MNIQSRLVALSLALAFTLSGCASANTELNSVDPLTSLKLGNERFMTGKIRSDGQSQADIKRLSSGQAPQAIVLSCSDSRVPPELVFDQKLGEMFTVRTAGESLSSQVIASIEFSIAKLGSNLIVVMGHTNCGAVKAALDTPNVKSAGSKNLDQLVNDIKPRIHASVKQHSKDFAVESLDNAKGVALDLVSRSDIIASAVKSGKVKIEVALYNLNDGSVTFSK